MEQIPADPFFVALYLNHLLQTRKTVGAIKSAVNGISWAHRVAGFPSPTDDPFVKLTAKGCERILGKPIRKSEPLTSPIVKYLFDQYLQDTSENNAPSRRFLLIVIL